jgi:acetamidase/formamidase
MFPPAFVGGTVENEFPEPEIKIWELNREAGFAQFKNMRIPLRPFLGCMPWAA